MARYLGNGVYEYLWQCPKSGHTEWGLYGRDRKMPRQCPCCKSYMMIVKTW